MRYVLFLPMLLILCAPAALAAQDSASAASRNHLEPGDVIRLRIWREEDMSAEFTVDADGNVVFPRLGAREVTGRDPTTLRNELVSAYSRFLRTPAIEVTFLRRVLVGGMVAKPGVYHIDPTMTVRDALMEAGGATPLGRPDRLELVRDGERLEVSLDQDMPLVDSPIRSGDQLYVPEKGWLARNTNAAVGIGGALLSFAATMIILAASR